jgi:hypothetical protein
MHKSHPSGIPTGVNKKVIGMMKIETGEKQIEEFVGLRAKLYAYKMEKTEKRKRNAMASIRQPSGKKLHSITTRNASSAVRNNGGE